MVAVSCFYLILGWVMVWRFQGACKRTGFEESEGSTTEMALWPSLVQFKPIHRIDEATLDCLRSFVHQDYPGRQRVVLASSRDIPELDPAALHAPSNVEVIWNKGTLEGTNRKIAAVAAAAQNVSEDYVILSDADMVASPDLLRQVMQPFAQEKVGMVTCLYIVRRANSWGDVWEGINVADFAASVLVARQVEGITFGLGAVMAMRRSVLDDLGGLAAFKDYLADDYQLGNQIFRRGYKVVLANTVVEDVADGATFWQYFMHQLRWMRTYRCNRPGGYFAFIVTQGMFWALLLALCSGGAWWSWVVVLAWMLLRALWSCDTWRRLSGKHAARYGLLAGIKDLIYVALWLLAFCGNTVEWGGERFRVGRDGKMVKVN